MTRTVVNYRPIWQGPSRTRRPAFVSRIAYRWPDHFCDCCGGPMIETDAINKIRGSVCRHCVTVDAIARNEKKRRDYRDGVSRIVAIAVQIGVLPKLDGSVLCVDCGAVATDYDHRDYNKPLDVAPTCHSCNLRRGPGLPVKAA